MEHPPPRSAVGLQIIAGVLFFAAAGWMAHAYGNNWDTLPEALTAGTVGGILVCVADWMATGPR